MRVQLLQKPMRRCALATLSSLLLVVLLLPAVSAGARPGPTRAKPTPGARVLKLDPRPKITTAASVAMSRDGNTLVVGQPGNFDDRSQTGTTAGSAYVFVRASHSSRWRQRAVLAAPSGNVAGDGFGQAVAIAAGGKEIAVGAPGTSVGGHPNDGGVYVFSRPSGGWSSNAPVASLTPSDPSDNRGVGGAVAISGSVVVAGNNHGQPVYLFERQAAQWASAAQTAELSGPPTPSECTAAARFNTFGAAVAVDGQTVAVSDNGFPSAKSCNTTGAVFIFQRPAGGWTNTATATATLQPKHGSGSDFFGQSIALQGRTLVAGAPSTLIRGIPFVGAVYVFERPTSGWRSATETARLAPSILYATDEFATSVGISGNTIVASNRYCPNGPAACPFVYHKPAGGWRSDTPSHELVPPPALQRAGGVQPVAVGGGTAVQVSQIKNLPVVVFPVSKAGSTRPK